MIKIITSRLYLLALLNIFSSISFSQTVINYQTWTGASGCNIFASSTNVPATTNGANTTIAHLTAIGQPTYDNLDKSVNLVSEIVNGSQNQGSEYTTTVNFKQGYSYKITVNAASIKPTQTEPNVLLRLDLNNGGNGGNTLCNGTGVIDASGSGGLKQSQQITGTTFTDYIFNYYSLVSFEPYLVIAAIPQIGISNQTILIRKITIEETPPPVSFTLPASTTFTCGTTTPQTFTVTNVNGTTGITNYTWNLGSASNNWLYNGSPAPQTVSTGTTGSISLTPVCGALQSNVSATVTANGNAYNTNTSSVSITPPTMSINGSDAICSGSSSYHVDGLPCNSTVVWSVSPLNVVASDANANSLTLTPTPTGNGIITVTATVSNVCGGNPIVISKPNIIVGSPASIGIDVGAGSFANMENCGDPTNFKVLYDATYHNYSGNLYVTASNATSLSWTEISNSSIPYWAWSTSNNGKTLNVSQKYANKYLTLKVTAANACGSISKTYTFGSDACPISVESAGVSNNYLLSPNPAGSNFSVSVNTARKSSETVSFAQIRIYDGTGNLKKQMKYESGTREAQINITDLRPGYYYVEISNGKTSIRKPLVVQR